MSQIKFTRHLVRFFPQLGEQPQIEAQGETVAEIVADLERQFPGLAAYLVDERGRLRKHVNIFIGQDLILDQERLSDRVDGDDLVYIFQARSGG